MFNLNKKQIEKLNHEIETYKQNEKDYNEKLLSRENEIQELKNELERIKIEKNQLELKFSNLKQESQLEEEQYTSENLNPVYILAKYWDRITESLLFDQYAIGITDAKIMEFIYYRKSKYLDLSAGKTLTGLPVNEGTLNYEIIKSKKKKIMRFTREESKYGVPYYACGVPIFNDNGEILGSFGAAFSTEQYDLIQENLESLNIHFSKFSDDLDVFSNNKELIFSDLKVVNEKVDSFFNQFKKIENLIKNIVDVAEKTHVIGINASIEASRASTYGKGFSVVAAEIQKLANSVSNAATEINNSMNVLNSDFEYIKDKIHLVKTDIKNLSFNEQKQLFLKDINKITGDINSVLIDTREIIA